MREPYDSRSDNLRWVQTALVVLVWATALASFALDGKAFAQKEADPQYKIVFFYYVSTIPTAWSNIRPVCGFSCNDRYHLDLGLTACQRLVGQGSTVQAQETVMNVSGGTCGAQLYAETCTTPPAAKADKSPKIAGDDFFCRGK